MKTRNAQTILTPTQIRLLRVVPTGHALDALGTAQDIAAAMDLPPASVARGLGALRRLGLVTRDAQGDAQGDATGRPTWARFDSIAPGLDKAQRDALAHAERAAPCFGQNAALESFGPDCPQAPNGIAWRSDLAQDSRDALESGSPHAIQALIAPALEAGRPRRAAALYRELIRHCAPALRPGHLATAERLERDALALEGERGAFGRGRAIAPPEPQDKAQNESDLANALGPCRPGDKARRLGDALEALGASYNATQGHAAPDALARAIAAAQDAPQAFDLVARPRTYLCRVCGQVATHVTNHTGPISAPCDSCSWRGGRDDCGRLFTALESHRPHVYAGPNPRGTGERNAPERNALPVPGDKLDNGAVVLEVWGTLETRALVLAFTGKGRACPFVVWRLERPVSVGSWSCYSGDYFATLGPARDALANRSALGAS